MSDTHELLRELSFVYDENNNDSYLSIYLSLEDRNKEKTISRRLQQIKHVIEDKKVRERIEVAVERSFEITKQRKSSARSMAIFIHLDSNKEWIKEIGAHIDTSMTLDASPYILPLARFSDDYDRFLLLMIDGKNAKIHYVEDAFASEESNLSHNAIGRHRKGGWSQMRYQRNREGIVRAFYDQVSEDLDELITIHNSPRIIIAGPGSAKIQFQERMSKRAKELMVIVEDADSSEINNSTLQKFLSLAERLEDSEEESYILQLKDGLMTGKSTAVGPKEVLVAAEEGRIKDLLLLEEHHISGMKCEPCQTYIFSKNANCSNCGSEGNEVDLANEAAEAAIRSRSHIEFIDDPFLDNLGGIAALLRW